MKSMKRRNKIFIFVILLLSLSIGFAYVNGLLKINGITNISKQTWDVHFANIEVNDGSEEVESEAEIDYDDPTKISYDVQLKNPGDYYEFTVDIVNDGSIDAMISNIISTNNDMVVDLPEYMRYSVTYSDGTPISQYQLLRKHSRDKYKVRVEIITDVSEEQLRNMSATDLTDLRLKLEAIYEQADENAYDRLDDSGE